MTGVRFGTLMAPSGELPWALYVPRGYDARSSWPLVVFLHGSGESGRDGVRQLSAGLGPALFAAPARWPALVVLPQKPSGDQEWEEVEDAVLALVDEIRSRYRVDPRRIVLTGMSQGGHGTWVLGARHPGLWAALAPVCGYGSALGGGAFRGGAAELAVPLARLPVWAFHGALDDVVPVRGSEGMVAAIVAAGGTARLTVFPAANHNAWDPAYRESGLAEWLLAQRR